MYFFLSLENEASSSTGHSGSKQHGPIIPIGSNKEATDKASSLVTSNEEYTELFRTESL